jgi:hypothetical protein
LQPVYFFVLWQSPERRIERVWRQRVGLGGKLPGFEELAYETKS